MSSPSLATIEALRDQAEINYQQRGLKSNPKKF
jgi:hypothetical protein